MIKGNPKNFCGFLLSVLGWRVDYDVPSEDKVVILGVPHTSILDFFIAYLFYTSLGRTAHIMIKKEMFVPPFSWFLLKVGCIPVDRSNGATVVRSVVHAAQKAKGQFHVCIAPEGTRKLVHRWKRGYHSIAHALGCPVYLGYFDWKRKVVGCGPRFEISEDAVADTNAIQALYEARDLGAKHPEKYATK